MMLLSSRMYDDSLIYYILSQGSMGNYIAFRVWKGGLFKLKYYLYMLYNNTFTNDVIYDLLLCQQQW